MAQAPELDEDMKELLAPVSEEGEIDGIEETLRTGTSRSVKLAIVLITIGLAGGFAGIVGWIGLYSGHVTKNLSITLAIGGTLLYLICIFSINPMRRFIARYRLITALLHTLTKVDPAMGTPPASADRQILAHKLIFCAKMAVYLGPLMARNLDRKIIRSKAACVSEVLRQCVYPALLGSDVELTDVATVLARAALKVGVSDWVKIGEWTIELKQYKIIPATRRERWANQLGPISLAVLTAIPAIPVLIGLLK